MSKDIPKWMLENTGYGTTRQFKICKRREIRQLQKALDALRSGCAWMNGGSAHVNAIEYHADQILNDLSIKNWGKS